MGVHLGRRGGVLSRVVTSVLACIHTHAAARKCQKEIRQASTPNLFYITFAFAHHPPTNLNFKKGSFLLDFGFGPCSSGDSRLFPRGLGVVWVPLLRWCWPRCPPGVGHPFPGFIGYRLVLIVFMPLPGAQGTSCLITCSRFN